MIAPPIPSNEVARLAALEASGLKSRLIDPALDEEVQLAALLFDVPMATVSLVDADRQLFRSAIGLSNGTPRAISFCGHAIIQPDRTLVVGDAHEDERFHDNPLVTGNPNIRFYAGHPIVDRSGHALGTLCVLDRQPRQPTPQQLGALAMLARRIGERVQLDGERRSAESREVEVRRALTDLAQRNDMARAIEAGTQVAIVSTDAEGLLRTVNAAAERLLGSPAAALVGKRRLEQLFAVSERMPADEEERWRVLTGPLQGTTTHRGEAHLHHATGQQFAARYSLSRVSSAVLDGYVAVLEDIEGQQALERYKDELLGTVSHELRTPLTTIRGSLGLLESGVLGPLSGESLEVVALARQGSERLIRLVDDLLDLEKVGNGRMPLDRRSCEAGQLVEQALQAVRGAAEHAGVELVSEPPAATLKVDVDPDRIVQVLTNLLGNAVKFSPRGGRVLLRFGRQGGRVRFAVVDQGPGLTDAQQAQLFRRFARVEPLDGRPRPGTGLGLAIVRALTEQHGGLSGVESVRGAGSTFWVDLPESPMRDPAETQQLIAALRAEFAADLPRRVEEVLAESRRALTDPEARQAAVRAAHRLHGTAGTYGFARVSTACAAIEELLGRPTVEETALQELLTRLEGSLAD